MIIFNIEAQTLKINSAGSATGNIWLEIDSKQFPAYQWNDFIVVLLGWWANAILRLLIGKSQKENVPFMDGPYAVELRLERRSSLRIRALQGARRDKEVASDEEPMEDFAVTLINQSRAVLDGCRQQAWWSEDVETLKSALEALEKEAGL